MEEAAFELGLQTAAVHEGGLWTMETLGFQSLIRLVSRKLHSLTRAVRSGSLQKKNPTFSGWKWGWRTCSPGLPSETTSCCLERESLYFSQEKKYGKEKNMVCNNKDQRLLSAYHVLGMQLQVHLILTTAL